MLYILQRDFVTLLNEKVGESNMKRTLLLLLGTTFLLGACNKEDTATYQLNHDGVNMMITNYFVDDTMTKQHIETTMAYKNLGYKSEQEARDANLDAEQDYLNEKGIHYKAHYEKTAIATELTINYDKVEDLSAIENLRGVAFDVDSTNPLNVNVTKIDMLLKENGFQKVEPK